MDDVWRLFAAIELTPEIRSRVAQVAERLRSAGWRARWVRPEGSHLTLKFYGNVPVAQIPALRDALRPAIESAAPLRLRAEGAGAFPAPKRPRVLWLGVGGDVDALARLQASIERASTALGLPAEERPFNPHLTLARIRPEDRETITDPERRLAEVGALSALPLPVERVTLFRSELRREGAVYTAVEEFTLRGAGR